MQFLLTLKLGPEIYYIKHCRTSPCIEDPVYVKASYFSTSRLQLIESKYKPNWTTCDNWQKLMWRNDTLKLTT